ncbi:MAG: glutamine-hydrolyzing GMP synthase [Chitinophagia bacterium]|nr:glutamine-hydrolyzing GMP synthase [Chitinophagia bacterium]
MNDTIIILDFGSQYTRLIAKVIRSLNIYCEILPYHASIPWDAMPVKGVVLSGGPASVNDDGHPTVDVAAIAQKVPVLAICYGAQLFVHNAGGKVGKSKHREYGRASLTIDSDNALFSQIPTPTTVWMSHSDSILSLPEGFEVLAQTDSIPVAACAAPAGYAPYPVLGIQFHPEVWHTEHGTQIYANFAINICQCRADWTPEAYIHSTIERIKAQTGSEKVLMALSGGVDSTVAATLIHQAIGSQLTCVFVDNGLLRKNEYQEVLNSYNGMGLNVVGIEAKEQFYDALQQQTDPETKRKIIGGLFITLFNDYAIANSDIRFLGQGTIYPDVIESMSVHGPSMVIKSHHNVGGLPASMRMQLIEPLRYLFKDEVRLVGKALGVPDTILQRHPFPGPGLGIRILGEVTPEKVALLQEADHIYQKHLKQSGWYGKVWQAGTILLPVKSVGVMGDERTYEYTCALRAVSSVDGMTADWVHLPYELLAAISNDIINSVKGINRVVYDISSKPPATIEWE